MNRITCVVLIMLGSSTARTNAPIVVFESERHTESLLSLAASETDGSGGVPHIDLPRATDPYTLPEYILALHDTLRDTATVEVEFVDRGAGIIQARIVHSEKPLVQTNPSRQASYTRLNTGAVRSAWFEFPAVEGASEATLRLGNLQHLRAVRIWPKFDDERWAELAQTVPQDVTPMVTLQRPMQLVTTAGIDVRGEVDSLSNSLAAMHELAPLAKVLGFTSIESYVTWKRLEVAEGDFDFSFYDAIVAKLQAYDLKWSPLIIVGSAYALPDWFSASNENVGFVCLEHGIENPIQSIWSPTHKRHVTRVLQAFGEHYDGKDILESVRLGPSGNYGESQYPAGGNWGYKGQAMHIHIGWWAGDSFARDDFRSFLQHRYPTVEALNDAWDTAYPNFDAVEMVLPETMVIKQRRLDFTEWYTDAMSVWCDWWVQESAKAMPNTKLYQSAGGWGFREAGTDYTAQTKSMVEVGGGIRLTNETDSYEQNFYATRLAATAARLYGVDLGYEPASSHTARGIAGRIYNTTATDGDHLFTYHHNVMNHPMEIEQWRALLPVLDTRQKPIVEVAVYYPETMNQLDDAAFRHLYAWGFNPRAREIRRVVDVDYLDERLIREGYLDRYKALVFTWSGTIEADVQAHIDRWIRHGGIVIYPSFPKGPLGTVDGNTHTFQAWERGDTGAGAFHRFPGDMEPPSLYGQYVREVLQTTPNLHSWVRLALDAVPPEHVFVTVQEDGHALALNYRPEKASLHLPGHDPVEIEPYGIARIALE